jgi:predicted DNA-binding transcriptional regulator YafY
MRNFGRLLELHRLLLGQRVPVSSARIQESLGCSRATVMRLIADLRDVSRDPIPYDRFSRGFSYLQPDELRHGLPYLWFSGAELHALLVIRHQLQQMQPGLLAEMMAPLEQRLEQLLGSDDIGAEAICKRIRVISGSRSMIATTSFFPQCAEAVLRRRRLAIHYRSRTTDQSIEREISPCRLVAYRDNWYMDAWCHLRDGLRRFAVERIADGRLLPSSAMDVPEEALDTLDVSGFGIFSGPSTATAVLRFTSRAARWIADETWHPKQVGRFMADERFELRVPYGEPMELMMEIMKHIPEVEVVEPIALRQAIETRLRTGLNLFSGVS